MNPADVFFYSDGARIAGYLFSPEDWKPGDAPRPGILVLAGYSGNTQADCTHMMKRLCAEGWFVFGFDYRGFGASEGQRNRHRPLEQAQNTFDALTYLQTVALSVGGRPRGMAAVQAVEFYEADPLECPKCRSVKSRPMRGIA